MSGLYKKSDRFRYMNSKQMMKWEKVRTKGKMSYVIIYGIFLWGIPVSIFGEFFSRIMKYGFTLDIFYRDHFVGKMIIHIVIFIFGGILFGLYMWNTMENKYQKSIENKDN